MNNKKCPLNFVFFSFWALREGYAAAAPVAGCSRASLGRGRFGSFLCDARQDALDPVTLVGFANDLVPEGGGDTAQYFPLKSLRVVHDDRHVHGLLRLDSPLGRGLERMNNLA